MTYRVLVYTNEAPDGEWTEALVWHGTSFIQAIRAFRREQKDPRGSYVALQWG